MPLLEARGVAVHLTNRVAQEHLDKVILVAQAAVGQVVVVVAQEQ